MGKQLRNKIILFLLPIVAIVLILFFIPINKRFAYHFIKGNCYDHGAWMYDRIYENEMPVDIAFIGSSRTLHAINEPLVEEKLNKATNGGFHVLNLGYCKQGRNFQYAVLKDLLSKKHPKLVVIEVSEDEQRSSHPSYPFIADTKDLLVAPFLNQYYIGDLFKSLTMRWEYIKNKLVFHDDKYPIDLSAFGYGSSTRVASEQEAIDNDRYWQRRLCRGYDGTWNKFLDSYPLYFLQKSIDLLNNKGIEYCFLYIPSMKKDVTQSVFHSYFEKKGKVYSISPNKYDKIDFWMDGTHFNDKGSDTISHDISNFLIEELCLK